jgi:hypothetical protein
MFQFQLFLNTYIPYKGFESCWGKAFSSSITSRPALGPTQLSVQLIPGFFPVGKRPEREVNRLPPSSAANEWRYTSTPPTCPYHMNSEHFTCYILHAFMLHINVGSTVCST